MIEDHRFCHSEEAEGGGGISFIMLEIPLLLRMFWMTGNRHVPFPHYGFLLSQD